MKMITNVLIYVIIMMAGTSCTDENTPEKKIDPDPIYAACCGAEPVEYTNDAGSYLYIPNAFTPNGDGVNDFFYPIVNKDYEYYSLVIYAGDWDTSTIQLFRKDYISMKDVEKSGWDGKDKEGKIYSGLFTYAIGCYPVSDSKKLIGHEGRACAISCETGKEFKDRQGCFYPVQVNNFKLDKNKNNGEENCFK